MKIVASMLVAAIMLASMCVHPSAEANDKKSADGKPLRVTVHPTQKRARRPIGGYSYSRTDSISAAETRRFIDPPRQSPSGPFDRDFFFDTPDSPRGGQSPYMN